MYVLPAEIYIRSTSRSTMPAKGKEKQQPTAGERTEEQQYEMEYRIWTDISNAMYEAGARIAEWIKRGGNKNDKRVWAAVKGIEVYTNGYIEAEKERLKGQIWNRGEALQCIR